MPEAQPSSLQAHTARGMLPSCLGGRPVKGAKPAANRQVRAVHEPAQTAVAALEARVWRS